MRRRPKDTYLKWMKKETPPREMRKDLIICYKDGGLKLFESSIAKLMGDIKIDQYQYTDPISGELLIWKYVGDHWWCRKHGGRYEFARMVALINDSITSEIDGLWDAGKHVNKQEPEIVYRGDQKGCIVGYNEFEVFVDWLVPDGFGVSLKHSGVVVPIRNAENLSFEFEEDFNKYQKIFANILKRLKK